MAKRVLFATALNENEMQQVAQKMLEQGFTNKSKFIRKSVGIE